MCVYNIRSRKFFEWNSLNNTTFAMFFKKTAGHSILTFKFFFSCIKYIFTFYSFDGSESSKNMHKLFKVDSFIIAETTK